MLAKFALPAVALFLCLLCVPAWGADIVIDSPVVGNVDGTDDPDTISVEPAGSLTGDLNGLAGDDQIGNAGLVGGSILGGAGADTITNSNQVGSDIAGTTNAAGQSGGSNTLTNRGAVGNNLIGSYNRGDGSSGGSNQITNSGPVSLWVVGSYNQGDDSSGGSNHLTNDDSNSNILIGSYNFGEKSSGGLNTLVSTGQSVNSAMVGSYNEGQDSSGGYNLIYNHGATQEIFGSYNVGLYSNGGSNTIYNYGQADYTAGSFTFLPDSVGGDNTIYNYGVAGEIYGSHNALLRASGGGNLLVNYGAVDTLAGSYNQADESEGGDNTVINYGIVTANMYGSLNEEDDTSGGGNTVTNYGTVSGNLYGSLNSGTGSSSTGNTVTNAGTVAGGLYAGGGDDTVVIQGTSTVGGVVDGQEGSDTLSFNGAGTRTPDQYLNFEKLDLSGGGTTLSGAWTFSGGTEVRSGTSLDLAAGASLSTASLEINSGGSANISGAATVSGNTQNAGSLRVNGTLTTSTLSNSGTLSGSGNVIGTVSNTGTIAPGNSIGILTITGDFINYASGKLAVEVNAEGNGDQLRVSGTATLNGGTVRASLARGLYLDGQSYNILVAGGGVNGAFSGVTTSLDSQTLRLSLAQQGGSVALQVRRNSFQSLGANATQRETGAALQSILPQAKSKSGAMANLIVTMDFGCSLAHIQQTLQAMSPEMYAAFNTASLQAASMFGDAVALRTASVRQARKLAAPLTVGRVSGPVGEAAQQAPPGRDHLAAMQPARGWSVWAQGLGNWSNLNGSDGRVGYDLSTGGAVAGADGPVLSWLRLGFLFGASQSDISWSQGGYSGDQKAGHGGVYASADLGGFHADLTLSYGSYENDGQRPVPHTSGIRADSSFDGQSFLSRLDGGYDFRAHGVVFGPVAALNYLYVEQDGFNESGAGDLALSVGDASQDYLISALGFQAATKFSQGALCFLPSFSLAWEHNFDANGQEITASFADYSANPFTVSGTDLAADVLSAQVGLEIRMSPDFSAFFNYGLSLGDNLTAQGVLLGLDWWF